ncbi:AfsR/SARP family transcriptional regulator [Kitasatospora sp. NBC_01250]|uniref:AfsR/SARP family transcriptional regulator n=1 Tax=Kitasatospora sp. NBC_01250 TaxID=2903571 RepID=UPI002E33D5DE|nr:AfsR/SARP family transcriptional regulator [Kitasatospora sp. NBC_01250]
MAVKELTRTTFQPQDLKFRVLGPLEVTHLDSSCTPTAPKVRSVLALLILRANHVVDTNSIIEELWGEKPPRSAITTAQTYIYHLRRLFDRQVGESVDELFITRPPGYALRISPDQLDLNDFERLTKKGRQLLSENRPADAAQALSEALRLWSGPALANVSPGRLLEGTVAHLEEERVHAIQLRIEADLQLGRHRALIAELRSLVSRYPLNEWFHGKLILALSRSGRRGESLQAYQALRQTLDRELGLAPSPELQKLQHDVLSVGSSA